MTPTSQPSVLPSASPSLDPCKGYDGVFGNTTDENTGTVVSYSYGVERNKAVEEKTGITLSGLIRMIESAMLNLLVGNFYSSCSSEPDNRFLSENIDSHLLGIGSSQVDLANGREHQSRITLNLK